MCPPKNGLPLHTINKGAIPMRTLNDELGDMVEYGCDATIHTHEDEIVINCFQGDEHIGSVNLNRHLPLDLLKLVQDARYILEASENSEAIALLEYIDTLAFKAALIPLNLK
jgi:hypothetical protein